MPDGSTERAKPVNIARCPEHGLHGERTECFVCGGPVEQVPMIEASEHLEALDTIRKLGEDLIESRDLLAQMADTLRGVLVLVSMDTPYPWEGGAFKEQIRQDVTAYELLGLDWPVPERQS